MVNIKNEIVSIIESSISTKQRLINDETIDYIKNVGKTVW
jgi:hypothetical protein